MGEPEGEITISADGPSSMQNKLAFIVLLLPICYFVLSGIDVGQLTSELDCDNPENDPRCNSNKDPHNLQFCCVIIPLFLSFVLFSSNISPHEEEE
tara:strand:- start:153 stop:440 length:288 start_codon:yes stop_codon:yes gene_type:complete